VEDSGGGPEAGALGDTTRRFGHRRQQAGFSIFLDQIADEVGEQHWETRLYHAESGAETSLPGASPDEWVAWLLEQLAAAGIDRPGATLRSTTASVRVASVDILDVQVTNEGVEGAAEIRTITAHVVVQLSGVAGVEREIGSRILRGLTASAAEESATSEHR
jgi:hypothetical protein